MINIRHQGKIWHSVENNAQAVAYPGYQNGRGRGAACSVGVRLGEGVSPSPLGEGSGRGTWPFPRKFFVFFVENTTIY